MLTYKVNCSVDDDIILEDSEFDNITGQTSLQDNQDDQVDFQEDTIGTEKNDGVSTQYKKPTEDSNGKSFTTNLSSFSDAIVKEATILCITIYSKSQKMKNEIAMFIDSKLKDANYDKSLKAMIVEKFVLGGVTTCTEKYANLDSTIRKEALKILYEAKSSPEEMEQMLTYDYNVFETKDQKLRENEKIVGNH